MKLNKYKMIEIVNMALKEDVGPLDITSTLCTSKMAKVRADIVAKEDGIICGLPVCEAVFEALNKDIKFKPEVNEGASVRKGKALCYLEGPARPILTGERTALNLLARLSGIATITRKFVDMAAGKNVKIMDTRKTTPGLRHLEKYAVTVGGGYNHRMGLWDQVLIKDNHIRIAKCAPQGIGKLIKDVRKKAQKNIKIEIETANLKDFEEALKGGPDIIMLDNMGLKDIKKAISIRDKKGKLPLIEVSGNITLENIKEYAECGPDVISVGSITHSARSLDLSMEIYG